MKLIKRFVFVFLLFGTIAICILNSFAHSGRTDSNGGHRDNKNKSGLGSYHYHHGYGPHLHTDGVCPYEQKQEIAVPAKKEPTKPKTVAVESIKIDSQDITLDIDETLTLSAIVNPSDASNKHVTWSSSDTNIAAVNSIGFITAISAGNTVITATADNGEKHSITLAVNEVIEIENNFSLAKSEDEILPEPEISIEPEPEPDTSVETQPQDNTDSIVNSSDNKDEESTDLTTGLGITGAVIAFIVYNTLKSKKK